MNMGLWLSLYSIVLKLNRGIGLGYLGWWWRSLGVCWVHHDGVPGRVQHVLGDGRQWATGSGGEGPEGDIGVYHGQGQEGVKHVLVGGWCSGF